MALTFNDLQNVTSLSDSDNILVRQSGIDKKATVSNIKAAVFSDANVTVKNIVPEMTGANGDVSVRNIGTPSARFASAYIDEVHVGAQTLYVNGKPVIQDNSNIMTFATDPDQGVNLKTQSTVAGTGNGNLQITSDNQIGLNAKGTIDISIASNVPSKNLTLTNQSSGGQILINSPSVGVTGNLTVTGNLSVTGDVTSVNTTNVNIADNLIVVNSNLTSGVPPTNLIGGIEVKRGDELSYRFVFEELTDTFKIGQQGQLQAVATREDNPTNGGYAIWDNATNKFITQAKSFVESNAANNFTVAPTILNQRIVVATQGASFPASPGFADECYRTDLDAWYKYNGAVWIEI